ncbi:hypothetical protein KEJ50_03435 [Candidatus Bathyarchaeota archaeon]|nr:hypothetical protein [Candidatus Bathyarchaeota archaeon]
MKSLREKFLTALIALIVFAIALAVRLWHLYEMPIDRLGESYHRWLINVLTLENNWVYTDFKPPPNMTIVWLPFPFYLTSFLMVLLNSKIILISRGLSVFLGSLSSVLIYFLAKKIYGSKWHGVIGGLVLAFQPWHMDFSTLAVAEPISSFLILTATFALLSNKRKVFALTSVLAMLTSYEAWVIIIPEALIGFLYFKWNLKKHLYIPLIFLLIILGWCAWSFIQAGNPIAWITSMLYTMFPYGWKLHLANPSELLFYVNLLLVTTFFIFFLSIIFGVLRCFETRVVSAVILTYLLYFTLIRYFGLEFGDPARLITLMPLMAFLTPSAFPKFKGGVIKRFLLVLSLILILIIPYYSQAWIFPKKVYVVMPDYRAGLALKHSYTGGKILSDFPTVIYYSNIELQNFLSYESLKWYLSSCDDAKLKDWFKENNVKFLVVENTSFTLAHKLFPELTFGEKIVHKGELTFKLIYEDTSKAGYWEHDYNVPNVYIYEVEF